MTSWLMFVSKGLVMALDMGPYLLQLIGLSVYLMLTIIDNTSRLHEECVYCAKINTNTTSNTCIHFLRRLVLK